MSDQTSNRINKNNKNASHRLKRSNSSGNFWFHRHPKIAFIFVVVLLLPTVLVLLELLLREAGVQPSFSFPCPVKELEIYNKFYTDGEGIFRANPDFPWQKECEVNSEGFRTPEFAEPVAGGRTVMFLGDSFTWGITAKPINHCFVDRVRAAGYRAVNLGIPGTGPNQYAVLAEHYVPRIKPDIVATVIYLRNDISHYPDPMVPNHNLYHITNAGWLWGFDGFDTEMKPISAEEAYAQAFGKSYSKAYMRHLAGKTVLGSRVWMFFDHSTPFKLGPNISHRTDYAIEAIQTIRRISQEHGAHFMLFIIPVNPILERKWNQLDIHLPLFADFNPLVPKGLTAMHYEALPGDHFNNTGHALYADFILEHIASLNSQCDLD